MNKGKALLGVLAGIAAGAALGVLFAPDKGSNTRKSLTKKSEDFADAINDAIDAKLKEILNTTACKCNKDKPNLSESERKA